VNKTEVLVLGASGMLGSIVTDFLSRSESLSVIATMRSPELIKKAPAYIKSVQWRRLEIKDQPQTVRQLQGLGKPDWIINAMGVIKPYARDNQPAEVERAIMVNAAFPHWLARTFDQSRILQIATDCVYSGAKGRYLEADLDGLLMSMAKPKASVRHCCRTLIIFAVQ